MAADEQIHEEVVRGLATRGRNRLAGTFRAAVFGANDGLVSNLSLVVGMAASGVASSVVLLSGIAGLLAGAMSMAAGEFVSVRSQRELLAATRPTQITLAAAPKLDLEHNELLLVYLARGMSREAAEHRVAERMGLLSCDCDPSLSLQPELPETEDQHEAVGTAWGAALSSFCFFASGAVVPILPFLFGLTGVAALVVAGVLVGLALLVTGGIVGLLSGTSPTSRGLRQLAIGLGAAAVTYVLGLAFGTVVG
jgi:VIT1/CCC1 family predicted Fe2+/Mn2+ transporter